MLRRLFTPKLQLKTTNIYFLSFFGSDPRSLVAGWLWLTVSSETAVSLSCLGCRSSRVTPMAVRRPQFLPTWAEFSIGWLRVLKIQQMASPKAVIQETDKVRKHTQDGSCSPFKT